MKLAYFVAFTLGLGAASANLIQKQASISDKATVGYATLYGGGNTVVLVPGTIVGNELIKVPANTSVIGKSGSALAGVGLRVIDVSNVIIRNLKIIKVLAEAGDAIGIQSANSLWVDSVELYSDCDHDQDYYDGLLDITHGSYGISVTNSYFHDHLKASLVGHSDSNGDEDIALQATFAYNKWENLNSRTSSIRFRHVHIFNNYFLNNNDGINVRDGAEALIQCNVFENVATPIYSPNNGYANALNNDLGGGSNMAPSTSWKNPIPSCIPIAQLKAYINANSGAKLPF
ncbi:hypothetical protein FS749_004056 [Ceratobasidium sp. UAMH 11750]|nr:hypothetical protein FS749_004056 [Ceratobasidium sp. UAMH 11750]